MARIQARTLYVFEYNYLLGSIRADALPDLVKNVDKGWRLFSREKPQVLGKEPKVKELVKQLDRAFRTITTEHPDTPWAVFAAREKMNARGLEWCATKE